MQRSSYRGRLAVLRVAIICVCAAAFVTMPGCGSRQAQIDGLQSVNERLSTYESPATQARIDDVLARVELGAISVEAAVLQLEGLVPREFLDFMATLLGKGREFTQAARLARDQTLVWSAQQRAANTDEIGRLESQQGDPWGWLDSAASILTVATTGSGLAAITGIIGLLRGKKSGRVEGATAVAKSIGAAKAVAPVIAEALKGEAGNAAKAELAAAPREVREAVRANKG